MGLLEAGVGRVVALGGLVLLFAGAGCGFVDRDAPPRSPATVHDDWAGCVGVGAFRAALTSPPELGKGGVPADFVPAAAIDCVVQSASGSETRADGVQRRTSRPEDLAALTAYLARPDKIGRRNQPCPAMAWLPPWLFLIDARQRWIQVQIPVDACGFPLDWFDADGRARWNQIRYADTVVCRSTDPDRWNCRPV